MHLMPASQLGAMRECVTALRRLLDGEELNEQGASFGFTGVKLTHPAPVGVPALYGRDRAENARALG